MPKFDPKTRLTTHNHSELGAPQDSTRKKAPVDTVRLKKDIDKDHAEHMADSKVISSGKAGEQETHMRMDRSQASLDRESARRDTLQKARKGGK